jgi:hypothetical protein
MTEKKIAKCPVCGKEYTKIWTEDNGMTWYEHGWEACGTKHKGKKWNPR